MSSVIEYLIDSENEIVEALEYARFKDGDSYSDDQLKKTRNDTVLFWSTRAEIKCNQPIFVVYKLMPPIPSGRADGQVATRKMEAYIDVVTTKKSGDPTLVKQLSNMEKAFKTKGWNFEMLRQDDYDSSNGRTIICFIIEKRV